MMICLQLFYLEIFSIYIQLLFLILLKKEEIMENNMKFLKLKF